VRYLSSNSKVFFLHRRSLVGTLLLYSNPEHNIMLYPPTGPTWSPWTFSKPGQWKKKIPVPRVRPTDIRATNGEPQVATREMRDTKSRYKKIIIINQPKTLSTKIAISPNLYNKPKLALQNQAVLVDCRFIQLVFFLSFVLPLRLCI